LKVQSSELEPQSHQNINEIPENEAFEEREGTVKKESEQGVLSPSEICSSIDPTLPPRPMLGVAESLLPVLPGPHCSTEVQTDRLSGEEKERLFPN
jgi:hypothetical protein